jgi:hypothetical protein
VAQDLTIALRPNKEIIAIPLTGREMRRLAVPNSLRVDGNILAGSVPGGLIRFEAVRRRDAATKMLPAQPQRVGPTTREEDRPLAFFNEVRQTFESAART